MQYPSLARHVVGVASLALALPVVASAQADPRNVPPATQVAPATDSTKAKARGDSVMQQGQPQGQPIVLRAPGIFNKRDLMVVGGATAAALALFPLDGRITRWMRAPSQQDNGLMDGVFAGAENGVEVGAQAASAALYVTGLVARNRTIADMGLHTLAAVGVAQVSTNLLKGAFGRSRPYASSDSLPRDWMWGGGFRQGGDRRSFPSGHTSHAFAFATALSSEISHASPKAGRIATPLLYAGATAAGLARVYHDKHWASDVAIGAGLGILSARTTLRFLHGRPNNVFDRVLLHTSIVPRANGATVGVTLPLK